MKYLKISTAILLIVASFSCKKPYVFNPKDLIGTWTQTQPYPPGSMGNQTYIFQFTSDSVFVSSPYSTRGAYSLVNNNNTISVDCNISEGPSCAGLGSDTYDIATGPNMLTIKSFFGYGSLSGPPPVYNLYMIKTN